MNMKRETDLAQEQESKLLHELCQRFREELRLRRYDACERESLDAMREFPHAAQPHNLLGVLMEAKGDHLLAMRHFRAAWALDPTYLPARYNMECTGTFFSPAAPCAIDESDCPEPPDRPGFRVEYDDRGVGRLTRRK